MRQVKPKKSWKRRLALPPLLLVAFVFFVLGWIPYVLAEKALEMKEPENEK